MNPERLAAGGAVQPGRCPRRPWWAYIEPLATLIAVLLAGGLIGFGLFAAVQ